MNRAMFRPGSDVEGGAGLGSPSSSAAIVKLRLQVDDDIGTFNSTARRNAMVGS